MKIAETSKKIAETAKEKGFWDRDRNIGELLMLVTSELGEALEAHRTVKYSPTQYIDIVKYTADDGKFKVYFEGKFKDTFEDEIADAVIRLFDLAEYCKIDLESHMAMKMRYNSLRPRLHGKAY